MGCLNDKAFEQDGKNDAESPAAASAAVPVAAENAMATDHSFINFRKIVAVQISV